MRLLIPETCRYSTSNYTAPKISSSFPLIFALKISTSLRFDSFPTQVRSDFTESFEGGFKVFDLSTRSTGWPWVLARGPFGLRLRARRRPGRSESMDDDLLGEDVEISNITPLTQAFQFPVQPLVIPEVCPHQTLPELAVVRNDKVEQFVDYNVIPNVSV